MNYFAILACGVMAVVLGYLWYGPFFGKVWRKSIGISAEQAASDMKSSAIKGKMLKSISIAFLGALLMAFVLDRAIMLGGTVEGLTGSSAGIHFALWNWLGFMLPLTLSPMLWEKRPFKWWLVTVSYYLADVLLMGLILANWH